DPSPPLTSVIDPGAIAPGTELEARNELSTGCDSARVDLFSIALRALELALDVANREPQQYRPSVRTRPRVARLQQLVDQPAHLLVGEPHVDLDGGPAR